MAFELLTAIREAARRDAMAFVNEYGEGLDPNTTDWGAVAWEGTWFDLKSKGLVNDENASDGLCRFGAAYDGLVARYTRELIAGNSAVHGWLVDSNTNDRLRPATEGERRASDESATRGENGHILVLWGDITRRCYVEI